MNLPFQIDLNGKVAVVTGAGGVLCRVFCEALALCGAKVALIGRRREPLEELASELKSKGLIAGAYPADVLNREALEIARIAINSDFGPCDILINGAGGNNPAATASAEYYRPEEAGEGSLTFFDLAREGFEAVFDLNLMGTLLPTQVFAREMASRGETSIINVTSMSAFRPLTKIPAYSAAKAAVSNLTQWMAVHFSKAGIRVNAIAPGFFVSEQNRNLLFNEAGEPSARAGKIIGSTPMGRFGEADELVGALLYLVSPRAAGFVTGVIIPVDGGFSAYSGV